MEKMPQILIVDDDPNLRKTLTDILELKGYTVAAAADGAAAVAQAQQVAVDVALIDLKLPDISGIEVMERIKAVSPYSEAIILTGHASIASAVEATNKGAFSYLLKPYEVDDLLQHLHLAVVRRRDQEEIRRLASFPRLSPFPMFELSMSGAITYANPAAEKRFPDLLASPQHPLLSGVQEVFAGFLHGGKPEFVREVVIGTNIYEQHLYHVAESSLVRVLVQDISERKAHEARIKSMNALLIAMLGITQYLLDAQSEEQLYRFVCEAMLKLEDVAVAWVGLKMPDGSVRLAASAGLDEAACAHCEDAWDAAGSAHGVAGTAIREGRHYVVGDLENNPQLASWREEISRLQLKEASGVPLAVDGEVVGALVIFSRRNEMFDPGVVNFLDEVAGDISIGVHTMRLSKKLHTTLTSLRKSLDSTIEAIASMMELRDPYTVGHQQRVAQLACALGREMGLNERQIEGLHVTGYLHDIGKIAVPAEILSRPVELSDTEQALVMAHVKSGYEILKNLEFPWPVAQAVLQHHERLDGSGYPQGLKGDEIILEARILMVADVVEAIVSHRPYRDSRGIKAALKEIAENRGTLYDPQVVDHCTELFTSKGFFFEKSPEHSQISERRARHVMV